MLPRPGVSRDRASRKGIPYLLYRPQVIRQDLRPAGRSPGYPQHLPILSSSSPPGNGFVELPPTAWCPVLCSRLCANGHETGRVSLGEHGGTISHTELGLCYGMVWVTERQDGGISQLLLQTTPKLRVTPPSVPCPGAAGGLRLAAPEQPVSGCTCIGLAQTAGRPGSLLVFVLVRSGQRPPGHALLCPSVKCQSHARPPVHAEDCACHFTNVRCRS